MIAGLEGTPITDQLAVMMAATVGSKGPNFLSCAPSNFYRSNGELDGTNIMRCEPLFSFALCVCVCVLLFILSLFLSR